MSASALLCNKVLHKQSSIFDIPKLMCQEATQYDAVMEVLNTKLLSLVDCEGDLLSVQVVEMALPEERGAGGIVNGINALTELPSQAELRFRLKLQWVYY